MNRGANLKCPTCKKQGDWFAGKFGPFCSRRCQLVDLGEWFNEEPRISEPLRPDHFLNEDDLADGDTPGSSSRSDEIPGT